VNPATQPSPVPPAADHRAFRPGLTLVALTGLNLFNYLDRYVLSALLTPLKAEWSLSDEQLGRLSTVFMLGYFLTAPIFGWLGDRLPRRWLIALGVFVWSLGTTLSGVASSFAMLVVFRILVGVGEASYATISPGWIADLWPPLKRNNALTIFYVAIPVGSAIGYALGGVIAARWGWRPAFLWAGAPGLLLALAMLALKEPPRGASDEKIATPADPAHEGLRAYLALFGMREYVLVVAGYTAYTFAMGAFAFWGPTFLVRVHGLGLEQAGTFFGAALVLSGLVATMLGGFAATAWQRRNPAGYAWVLALSTLAAAPVAFGAFSVSATGLSMALLVTAMFLLFLSTGPVNTLILETVPAAMRARAMAASIFVIHLLGDLWSPQIVGWVADGHGGLGRGVLLLPVALLVGGMLWTWLARVQRPARA